MCGFLNRVIDFLIEWINNFMLLGIVILRVICVILFFVVLLLVIIKSGVFNFLVYIIVICL